MASINGDWFHSRVSSRWDELLAIRHLVLESQKIQYIGFNWSGGREDNPIMERFALTINVRPSTMQTKIRNFIRLGFVKDNTICPLQWTRLGELWNDLYTVGNIEAAQKIYQLTITIALAIYAFNDSREQYSINPLNGDRPLQTLLNILQENKISLIEFSALVDGTKTGVAKNTSYWKTDLINSGLFYESDGSLVYSGIYPELVGEIRNFEPSPHLSDANWREIRDNPLIENSPFKVTVRQIFENITQEQNIEEQITDEMFTAPLVEVISEQEEVALSEVDILSDDLRFASSTRRVRNATCAIRLKKKYNYLCAVPNCDVKGQIFVEAAHIKPDNVPVESTPHRTHILNGLCLCKHCHIAFDRGYFSLTDDHRIITSSKFNEIADQNLKTVILSSSDNIIKSRVDNRLPLVEFIQYHRSNKFKN
jgi:predicted restriction endonuclease